MDEEWLGVVLESSAEVGLHTTTVQALKDLLIAERSLNCTWFSMHDLSPPLQLLFGEQDSPRDYFFFIYC